MRLRLYSKLLLVIFIIINFLLVILTNMYVNQNPKHNLIAFSKYTNGENDKIQLLTINELNLFLSKYEFAVKTIFLHSGFRV